jgi:hypothetical protein
MIRWPWFTLLIAVLLAVSPPGRELIHDAYFSSEQLSRNIAQPIVLIAALIVLGLAIIELCIGRMVRKRRAKKS